MESVEGEEILRGQRDIFRIMLAFADSMALKCAIELGIADMLATSSGGCLTLSELASQLDSPTAPDLNCLGRIMRLLVRKGVFAAQQPPDGTALEDTLYSLTPSSRWILRGGTSPSLAPMILMQYHPAAMARWHCLSRCVREAGSEEFKMAQGRDLWEVMAENPELNGIFNEGMECTANIIVGAIFEVYKDGFGGIGSLVDVGGGTGGAVAEIVKAYPHIKGINFDLPHVITTAPSHEGVVHVSGDMFDSIPRADAVFMKWVMHNWTDADCVKILRNCKKALPKKNGKVIIVELVLRPEGNGMFDETGLAFDLMMIATGGRERTEPEWKKILEQGGFPRYNIINLPSLFSIIEASPE